jgi:hypothetical protein
MKKIAKLAAAVIILFCIVPFSTTQAMPRQLQENENVVSVQLDECLSVFNHKKLRANILTYGNQEFREIIMAQGDTNNPYVKRQGNGYPHVMRRGNGRSTMGDKVAADNNSDVEDDENEDSEDGSSIKSNKNLENSSGYNEDL